MSNWICGMALVCVTASGLWAQEATEPPEEGPSPAQVAAWLQHPPATGLMLLFLAPDGQAAKAGLKIGDVLESYGGQKVATLPALKAAMAGMAPGEDVVLVIVRGDKRLQAKVKAGSIGVNIVDVQKGVARELRPPATAVAFDFATLKAGPKETWAAFYIGGKKAGFERHLLSLKDGNLILDSVVAFDGGKQWGVNHFEVRVTATAAAQPKLLACRHTFPPTGFISDGKRAGNDWKTDLTYPDPATKEGEKPQMQHTSHTIRNAPVDLMSDYLATELATWLPREQGTCWYYTMLDVVAGELGLPSALFVAEAEQTDVRGQKATAWRIESHNMGNIGRKSWVDGASKALKHLYGPGAEAFPTTKADALADLPASIAPIAVKVK